MKTHVQAAGVWTTYTIFEQHDGVTLSPILCSMNEAEENSSVIKHNMHTCFSLLDRMCAGHIIMLINVEFIFKGLFFFHIWLNLKFTDINEWHSLSRVRGVSSAEAHTFFKIWWCVLGVTWTLRANSVINADNERDRERDPQRHCFCSPLRQSFHSNCSLDCLWSLVPGPGADDGCPHLPSSIPICFQLP